MRGPEDIMRLVRQRYDNQCQPWLDGAGSWPLSFSLERPTQDAAMQDHDAVRRWTDAWQAWRAPSPDVAFQTEKVEWRKMGAQTMPCRIAFATPECVADYIGKGASWRRAVLRRERLLERWPCLANAGLGSHFDLLANWNDTDFAILMALMAWFEVNPRSRLYVRQLPVPGIDTKWIESGRRATVFGILQKLHRHAIPSADEPIRDEDRELYKMCGLLRSPYRMRIMLLCPALRRAAGGLRDIETPSKECAALELAPQRALIVENLVSGYALPDLPGTVAFLKLGKAVPVVRNMPWMAGVPVMYWGDIDTHGFSILALARKVLGNVTSILMDEATLQAHLDRCVRDTSRTPNADRSALTPAECAVYAGLLDDTWGTSLRLEQERIGWPYVLDRLGHALT